MKPEEWREQAARAKKCCGTCGWYKFGRCTYHGYENDPDECCTDARAWRWNGTVIRKHEIRVARDVDYEKLHLLPLEERRRRFIQAENPSTGGWAIIDRDRGRIVGEVPDKIDGVPVYEED